MTLILVNFRIHPTNLLAFIPLSATQLSNMLASHPNTGLHRFVNQFCHDHNLRTEDQIFFLLSGMETLRETDKAQYNNNCQALVSVQFDHLTNEINMDNHPIERLYSHFDVLGVY